MNIKLHYGPDFVSFSVPESRIANIIKPWKNPLVSDNKDVIKDSISNPYSQNIARDFSGKKLCILLPDYTRDIPVYEILSELQTLIKKSSFVKFIICTGTHDPEAEGNKKIVDSITAMCKNINPDSFDVFLHDCRASFFTSLGKTSRGTEIVYNNIIDDCELFLVLSDVKFHYFAGYSNPVKYFVPGIGSFSTVEANHSLALDERSTFGVHPWHSNPARQDNPVARDQLECMERILAGRKVLAFVTISSSGKIQWAGLGDAKTVTRQAFDITDKSNMKNILPVKYLIVSPGGTPNDIDLYISQRALELTKQAVLEKGEVLFISACPNGIGSKITLENFYQPLCQPLDKIFELANADYRLFSHKPYKFAEMIKRLSKIWVYSEMEPKLIKDAHLYPTDNIQDIVDKWVETDPEAQITIVDGANKIALYNDQIANNI